MKHLKWTRNEIQRNYEKKAIQLNTAHEKYGKLEKKLYTQVIRRAVTRNGQYNRAVDNDCMVYEALHPQRPVQYKAGEDAGGREERKNKNKKDETGRVREASVIRQEAMNPLNG